ncbi:hypothetical protein CL631_02180 [bacterium]|mgnify:CR=1 FL=1|nr:hypothetical protein [bacterium]|tara:strand:- start:839 stop:1048 length:210 start_codon:yes stop_codon:yes gene_type:complete
MKLQIYYTHVTGAVDHCGETDLHPEEWVKRNNEERWKDVVCGFGDEEQHNNRDCTCIEDVDEFEFKYVG